MSELVTGRDIRAGDEFRSAGRWYTVVSFASQGERERPGIRVAFTRTRKGASQQILVFDADGYQVNRPVPPEQRFRPGRRAKLSYSENHPVMHSREVWIISDDGGPKVKVSWRGADGPKVGRRVVAYYGKEHEQWVPRGRLSIPVP